MNKVIGVYKISNTVSGKYYIGYSEDINKRFKEHRSTLEHGNHQNIVLQRSYNKHGADKFIFEILNQCDTVEKAKEQELVYLQNLEIRPLLYNLHYNNSGGDILSTHPDREQIIQRMSSTLKSNYSKMTEQERKDKHGQPGEKNGMFGKTHTDEVKQALSERKASTETRKKISDHAKTRLQEKNPMYGKKLSDEAKKKLSEQNKGQLSNTVVGVTINNVSYKSLAEASKTLAIPVSTILWRVNSKNTKFDNYTYTDVSKIQKLLSTKISVNNVEYNSIAEACRKLNFSTEYVTNRLKSDLDEDREWKILDTARDKRLQVGRKVEINGNVYNSVKEASQKLNINEAVLTKILNAKEPIPVSSKKKVSIDGVIYESVSEASEKLTTNINVVIKRLKSASPKFKDHYYLPIEYYNLSLYKYV